MAGALAQKVLLVDDEPDIVELLKYNLEREGYQVSTALNGRDAIKTAKSTRPDLIVLDIMMPRRSGFLVLERLRQELEHPIPVVMVTGNFGERHRAYAEMLGVSGYFYKPVKFPQLLDKINELLEPGE